ncbi:MAG: Snf1-like ser/thr protein kinase [Monoraphidium minutum]|nr:MAG: Snf1-like ser/thr protein kinase [Monoraphidium minutum]
MLDKPHGPLLEGEYVALNCKYRKLEVLGTGTFGQVLLARNCATGEVVAVKVVRRGSVGKYLEREILNHCQLRHPHVIQFREAFLAPGHVCIAMEYASGGTLFSYLQRCGRLHEPVARWFFQQLLLGVDYCHRRGVANRDLKLENTLLQIAPELPLPLVKICDFGYSKAEGDTAAKSKVGTSTYMAPEILINHTAAPSYDSKAADVWSCGVMLFVMVCGCYPFGSLLDKDGAAPPAHEALRVLERMLARDHAAPPGVDLTPDCADLLARMLAPDPGTRISVPEIIDHPWFQVNLPPRAKEMNEQYLSLPLPCGDEDLAAIRELVAEAAGSAAAAAAAAAARAAALRAGGRDEALRAAARAARRRAPRGAEAEAAAAAGGCRAAAWARGGGGGGGGAQGAGAHARALLLDGPLAAAATAATGGRGAAAAVLVPQQAT